MRALGTSDVLINWYPMREKTMIAHRTAKYWIIGKMSDPILRRRYHVTFDASFRSHDVLEGGLLSSSIQRYCPLPSKVHSYLCQVSPTISSKPTDNERCKIPNSNWRLTTEQLKVAMQLSALKLWKLNAFKCYDNRVMTQQRARIFYLK